MRPAPHVEDLAVADLDLSSGRRVLAFLSTTCAPCRQVWAAPGDAVIITADPATEDARLVARLAGPDTQVVMSSAAWFAYRAGPAPWRVVVEDGTIVEEGPWVTPDRPAGRPPRPRWLRIPRPRSAHR